MHVRCPHCKIGIEVVNRDAPSELSCPSCGSRIPLTELDTVTVAAPMQRQSVGRYQLLEWVGRGKFGDVWKGRDPNLDRLVAVKIPRKTELEPDEIAYFLRDAQAQAQLNHPNIIKVHDAQQIGDTLYIVSDFIQGVTLQDWLSQKSADPLFAARLCATVARAVHHAHERGIIHRDLKPANIMLDENETPLVLDFGLAKREQAEFTIAVDGAILGTPAYMPPEQARGNARDADARSDVYSIGVILYEMLAGQRPFSGGTRLLLHQILHDEPKPPHKLRPNLPQDLETICLAAMEKDPNRRYPTAAAMADDLDRFLAGEPIQRRPVSKFERTRRWARRNPTTSLLAIAILILAIWGSVISLNYARVLRREYLAGHQWVNLQTDPPGARVTFVPVDETTRAYQADRAVRPKTVTPLKGVVLPPGEYLVIVVVDGYGFHEVYRTVPQRDAPEASYLVKHRHWNQMDDGSVELPPVRIVPEKDVIQGMARIEGGTIQLGDSYVPGEEAFAPTGSQPTTEVLPFYMDVTEVTCREYRQQFEYLPTAINGDDVKTADSLPVTHVTFHQALEYAERVGKRLMSEKEYVFAATNGGRYKYPWGNFAPPDEEPWLIANVDSDSHDKTSSTPPILGLYSNAAEWIDATWFQSAEASRFPEVMAMNALGRIVQGGPQAVALGNLPNREERELGARWRFNMMKDQGFPGVGFRCVRSAQPRFQSE